MKSNYQIEIISRIKKLRELNKKNQAEIALIIGKSDGQVGTIESIRSGHKYRLEQIFMICQEFNYRIEHIFLTEEELSSGKDIIDLLIKNIIKYQQTQKKK